MLKKKGLSYNFKSKIVNWLTGPDSTNGRASASGARGRGFVSRPRHTKGVENGTSGYLAWRSAL